MNHSPARIQSPRHLEPVVIPSVVTMLRRYYRISPVRRADRRSRETDWAARWRRIVYADPCPYCGDTVETLDHIHPLAHNGGSHYTNLTGSCLRCNQQKSSTPLLLFVLGRYQTIRSRPRPAPRQWMGLFAQKLSAALAELPA